MKKTLLLFLICQISLAQNLIKKNLISLSVGRTFMGTGDMLGYNVGFGFQKQFSKHFGIETNIRATSASSVTYFPVNSNTALNQGFNTELRFNTSGIQFEVLPFLPIINRTFKLSLLAGPVLRQQTNTRPNPYAFNYYQNINILSVKYDRSKHTNSLGISGQIEAAFRIKNKNYVGARLAGHFYVGDLNWYMPIVYQRQI